MSDINLARLDETTIDDIFWDADKSNYIERPVTLKTFIHDDRYLGQLFNENGHSTIYDFWLKLLYKVYPSPFYTPYSEVILSCAIGVGKSTITTVSMLYELYKLLCLKNPASYYGLMKTDTIVMAIFSSTKENVGDVNWNKMRDAIVISPWFQKRLNLDKAEPKIKSLDIAKNVSIQLGSRYQHAIGRDVLLAVVDEGNNKLLNDQVKTNYIEIQRRRDSRFKDGFSVPGILWLISSPKTVDDFLNERITSAKRDDTVLVVDNVPTWVAKKGKNVYCGRTFFVFLGDEQHDPRILSKVENPQTFPEDLIMEVPVEHYKEFVDDILGAIRDVGGRRVQQSTALFKSREVISKTFTIPNLFTKDIIMMDVTDRYEDIVMYMDLVALKQKLKVKNRRYLHIDYGFNGDMFGLAATYSAFKDFSMNTNTALASTKYIENLKQTGLYEAAQDRKFIVDWAVGFKASTKSGVPMSSIVQFINYLRRIGYPIAGITGDKPSIIALQELEILGFDTSYLSVDTTRTPYLTLKNKMYEGAVVGCVNKRLIREMKHLKDDGVMVDHPDKFNDNNDGDLCGNKGGKDIADGVAGSFISAFKNPVSTSAEDLINAFIDAGVSQNSMYESTKGFESLV